LTVVEVEIITGVPLTTGSPRYPIEGFPVRTVRSPYARDLVYRWQNQRGFGRLTMTALHLDEEWFCRAAWRLVTSSGRPPDVLHAHALHQAARLRVGNIPVVINLPGRPNPSLYGGFAGRRRARRRRLGGGELAGSSRLRGRPAAQGVDSDRFRPEGQTGGRRFASRASVWS
jgi:hypothetical protein